jgi:hypothetical protein
MAGIWQAGCIQAENAALSLAAQNDKNAGGRI